MSDFDSVKDVLKKFDSKGDRYISREFQKYAYDLAEELGDLKHKSLYMRLAKNTSRQLLERARYFVKDAAKVENRGKLFMWKLSQLKKEQQNAKVDTQGSRTK